MATRKPMFLTEYGGEEMAAADDIALGGLAMSGDITMSGNEVTGLPATPTGDTAAASKAYVDAIAAGLHPKEQAKALADSNQTLSGLPTNIDGVTSWSANDRILLTGQTTDSQNGIWLVQTGAWTRPSDFATGDGASGAFCFVDQGTNYADSAWFCTTNVGSDTIDTDDLAFAQFSQIPFTGGDGIDISSGTISVDLAATNPCLYFDSSKLSFQINGSTLEKTGTGARVKGLPSLFEVNGVAVSANVTAPNLDALTGGGVTALHSHAAATAAERLEAELTAEEALAKGDPIEWGTTNDEIRQCRASVTARVDCFGIVEEAAGIGLGATGTCVRRGPATVLTGATVGNRYFVASAGGLIQGIGGLAAGDHIVFVGTAINATELEVNPYYVGRKAA